MADSRGQLIRDAAALLEGTRHPLANAANLSALIYGAMDHLNWAGFYFMHRGELLLGPFQGKPACLRIALTRGVCGAAASSDETQRVKDVHDFPGHIACDAASQSELVVPIRAQGRVVGVMDLDSPLKARFTEADQAALEQIAVLYERACDWEKTGYDLR